MNIAGEIVIQNVGNWLAQANKKGSYRTKTFFINKNGSKFNARSFVVSVSCLMKKSNFPANTPYIEEILKNSPDNLANGGSGIAGPDGEWIIEPIVDKEGVFSCELNLNRVFEERQNFDPVGHYSRPDVTQLIVNNDRQTSVKLVSKKNSKNE